MSTTDLKALGRHFIEEMNKGKSAASAVMDELFANDIVYHFPFSNDVRGINDVKKQLLGFLDAFPDFHWFTEEQIVEGDRITTRAIMSGTMKGGFMGFPPSGKKMTVLTINIAHAAGGKIVEEWERTDTLGVMQQLGFIPMPKK
jgi:predicted ester cyclase